MSFVSIEFVMLILPCILVGFSLLQRNAPQLSAYYLLAIIYTGLIIIDPFSLVLVFLTSSINFLLVQKIAKSDQPRHWIVIGTLIALLPLLGYKFGPELLGTATTQEGVIFTHGVPIGLSFYALQQITALVDCRKANVCRLSYSRHLLYSAFFPNFNAGPIFPYQRAAQQFYELGFRSIPHDQLGNGLNLLMVGLLKKLWIAQPIGSAVNHLLNMIQEPHIKLTLLEGWFIVWGFLVHLYFDFSAYSDIAIGLALCFGVVLPINFDSPLKAKNTQDYVARWHISFTAFIREYFFFPFVGVFRKIPIKNTEHKMFLAWFTGMFFSYFFIGIWHSPNLVFMVSSMIVITVYFSVSLLRMKVFNASPLDKQTKFRIPLLSQILLLLFSMLMGVFLKTQDFDIIVMVYRSLIDVSNISIGYSAALFIPDPLLTYIRIDGYLPQLTNFTFGEFLFNYPRSFAICLVLATLIVFFSPNTMELFQIKKKPVEGASYRWGTGLRFFIMFAITLILALTPLLEHQQLEKFVYEQF